MHVLNDDDDNMKTYGMLGACAHRYYKLPLLTIKTHAVHNWLASTALRKQPKSLPCSISVNFVDHHNDLLVEG